jgi:hypothetical protein
MKVQSFFDLIHSPALLLYRITVRQGDMLMSGGSSSGSGFDSWRTSGGATKPSGGGGGAGGGTDKCAIYETAVLASPVPAVIATLSVGDILAVDLETSPRDRVVVRTNGGQVAGAITSIRLVDIIECIGEGFSYQAEVKSINGGKIEVEIRPA